MVEQRNKSNSDAPVTLQTIRTESVTVQTVRTESFTVWTVRKCRVHPVNGASAARVLLSSIGLRIGQAEYPSHRPFALSVLRQDPGK